ncbi:MAG: hypothetical protein AVDCRST_MAG17-2254, partial [uncultured Solirubrobacterales bacterium]
CHSAASAPSLNRAAGRSRCACARLPCSSVGYQLRPPRASTETSTSSTPSTTRSFSGRTASAGCTSSPNWSPRPSRCSRSCAAGSARPSPSPSSPACTSREPTGPPTSRRATGSGPTLQRWSTPPSVATPARPSTTPAATGGGA